MCFRIIAVERKCPANTGRRHIHMAEFTVDCTQHQPGFGIGAVWRAQLRQQGFGFWQAIAVQQCQGFL